MVLGLTMLFAGSYYATAGLLKVELENTLVSGAPNYATIATVYAGYANTGEYVVILGAVLAPVGAAVLTYGFSTVKAKDTEEEPFTDAGMAPDASTS